MPRLPPRIRSQQSHLQQSHRLRNLLPASQKPESHDLIPRRVAIDVDSDLEGSEPKVRSQAHRQTSPLRRLHRNRKIRRLTLG
jgi:hypothetical protein